MFFGEMNIFIIFEKDGDLPFKVSLLKYNCVHEICLYSKIKSLNLIVNHFI